MHVNKLKQTKDKPGVLNTGANSLREPGLDNTSQKMFS